MQSDVQNHGVEKGQVLTKAEVDAEVARLCADLRDARKRFRRTTREVAAAMQISQATVWRIETAQNQPTFLRFILLTLAANHLVDLDDGTGRPLVPGELWPWSTQYPDTPPISAGPTGRGPLRDRHQVTAQSFRERVGSELWFARRFETGEPLSAEEACRRLDMNHHTLSDVELGPGWPSLASVVRVAALAGRRVVLNAGEDGWRTPPWVPSTWLPTPSHDREPD